MNKKQQIAVLVLLLLVGGGIWAWQYWPSAGAGSNGNSSAFLRDYQRLNFPNSQLDWGAVDRRRKAEYKPSGANLFSMVVSPSQEELNKAAREQQKIADAQRIAALSAPLPQLDLPPGMKFFGYGTVPNGTPRLAFLSYQDDVFIVGEGDTLMGRYKIVKINNSNLEFEEVATGRRGQKNLEDQGQGPNA